MPGASSTSRPGTPGGAIAMLASGSGARRAHSSATDAGPRKLPSAPPRMIDAVDAALVAQVEHEVAVDAVAARRAQHAAREHDDVDVAPVGDLGDARQQRGLVGLAQRIDQHADAGPLGPPQPRLAAGSVPRHAGRTRSGRASASRTLVSRGRDVSGTSSILALVKPAAGQAAVAPRDGRSDTCALIVADLRDRRAGRLPRAARGARGGDADPPGRAAGVQAGDRGAVAGRLRQEDGAEDGRPAVHQGAGGVSCSTRASCRPGSTSATRPRGSSSITPSARCASRCRRRASCRSTSQRFETINEDVGVPERDRARGSQPLVHARRGPRWSTARWRRARWTARRSTPRSCSRRSWRGTATRW